MLYYDAIALNCLLMFFVVLLSLFAKYLWDAGDEFAKQRDMSQASLSVTAGQLARTQERLDAVTIERNRYSALCYDLTTPGDLPSVPTNDGGPARAQHAVLQALRSRSDAMRRAQTSAARLADELRDSVAVHGATNNNVLAAMETYMTTRQMMAHGNYDPGSPAGSFSATAVNQPIIPPERLRRIEVQGRADGSDHAAVLGCLSGAGPDVGRAG